MSSNTEVKDGYTSTLQDLTFNSKPLISVLTMLAEENVAHAKEIVEAIETHLSKVRIEVKLPVLYLVDCIIKNVGGPYLSLFSQNIVSTFCTVFEKVDERTRAEMFKLRQTWNDVLPSKKLYALDVQIHLVDPAWPVTAPPPANSIHFNPKFLKTTNTSIVKKEPSKTVTNPLIRCAALDSETLNMQQKLIVKQKELLELQQKKIELELLQAQVKFQEQLKSQNVSVGTDNVLLSKAKNLLLKPEVAKQLSSTAATSTVSNLKSKAASSGTSSVMNKKLQNFTTGTKIAPVNSTLVSAVRPIRDPRLLRHQGNGNNVNSNVQLENKTNQSVSVESNNKIVNSKMSVRDNRTEPRLVNNKDNVPILGKAKAMPRIPLKNSSKIPDPYRKAPKSSRSSKSSSSDGSSSKGSTSSLDSPSKIKSDKNDSPKSRSPSKSPAKHKKKDISSRSDKKSEKSTKSSKSDSKCPKSDSSPTAFKDLKGSTKNRNYIRRNRDTSASPESNYDVDLRLNGPPEKQPRLQPSPDEDITASKKNASSGMDVDLRQLPTAVGKKRLSTETAESGGKKSKSEIFDALFGNEDTDLRQITAISPTKTPERPPTPPPPIISNDTPMKDQVKDVKFKKESPKAKNLEEVRAKLANATIRSKLDFKGKQTDDKDFKSFMASDDVKNKIIISPADEQCIKAGNMTKAQETALMSKIIAQIENQKLREAKRLDSEENLGNISLQPISDEELEADFSESENEEEHKKNTIFVDQIERIGSSAQFYNFPRGVDLRRMNWRGRRNVSGVGPYIRPSIRGRPGVDPWIRPLIPHGPWRPMAPNYVKPQHDNYIPSEHEVLNVEDSSSPKPFSRPDTPDLVVDSVNQDDIKSINIDGVPRDIRYYDETAVAFMSWDDPREISFQNGSRRVIIDEKDVFMLNFNEQYREITLNGVMHQIKLGAPTREFYIDGKWYECYFGGSGIGVEIDGKICIIKLDGPPPQVKIGDIKRTDLVGGKINLIIDAKSIVPVFLDAKIQKFDIDGKIHTLQFIDALRTVLINDVPFKVEFGGLPKPFTVHDKKHFIRFSVLPKGIKPGYVNIKDMPGSRLNSPRVENENSQDSHPAFEVNMDINEPALPVMGKKKKQPDSPERNSNSPFQYQNLMQQQNLNNLDVLSSVMATSMVSKPNVSGYQVANVSNESLTSVSNPVLVSNTPILPTNLNINDLFQKLVATGIVTSALSEAKPLPPQKTPQPRKERSIHTMKPVYFDKTETLKTRQSALITSLYSGMQCSSCGMRFPPEQSIQYSQHLDWHFRQNRKGKKNIRKASSRRWYYSLSDWKNYEEIEDLEEREKNFFDQQQAQGESGNEEADEEIEIPSVPADADVQDPRCEVCQDRFEQFYNEEKEEWHLRMAIRVDGKTYHPLCYEDYQASLVETTLEDSAIECESKTKIPGLEVTMESEDNKNQEIIDDEIVIDDTDSVVTENSEPAKKVAELSELKTSNEEEEPDDDDDVIIHEVIPEKIVVDDDDKDDSFTAIDEKMDNFLVKQELADDDGFMDVEGLIKLQNFGSIKIKSEPIDPDETLEDPILEEEMKERDTTHTEVVASIDGNVEFESGTPTPSGISGKIKINITKPLPVLNHPKENNKDIVSDAVNDKESIDPTQPLPPGEESIQLNLKPTLRGVNLRKLPPVKRGSDLTGLCSIM